MASKKSKTDTPPPASENLLRISQAATAAGLSKQTIEYYIMLGLVRPSSNPAKRGRFFDDATIRRIKLINQLNQSGYTLGAIRDIYFSGKKP